MPHEIIWTGQRLRDARTRLTRHDGKPVSQADLARMIGASPRSITSWEAGDATPHPNSNAKLTEVFADQIPREEVLAGPRLKEATVPELLAELQLRFAHLARVARQTPTR